MSFIADVHEVLSEDTELLALLTGGIYSGSGDQGVREISRQNTPQAFDAQSKILPCLLVVSNTDLRRGPFSRSIMTTFSTYFYQRTGYDVIESAMARAYDLLHEQRIGERIWEITFDIATGNQHDPALDCSLSTQRWIATRMAREYEPQGS